VDLQNHYQYFQQQNTEIIALAVQSPTNAGRMVQVTGATFPILADPDHTVTEAYGVFNLLGDGVATPAVFIIDRSGEIVWSYIGQNANDRPDAQTVLENLPTQ
jgi:peroxiredoxin